MCGWGEIAVIVRMGLLRKQADLSLSAFERHWRDSHQPIVAELPGLRGYHRNLVVDRQQLGIDYARGGYDFDGVSQLWFDDVASMHAAFDSDVGRAIVEDERRFVGDIAIITTIQHVVVPRPAGAALVKRMSTLTRREDVGSDTFQNEWFDIHSVLVKRIPEVKGYAQDLVFERMLGRRPAARADLRIDGIVELWFDDIERLKEGFASGAGKTLMTHAAEFIGEISTFLVETEEVV